MLFIRLLTFAESCEESELGDLSDFKHCESSFCRKERIEMFLLIVVTALEWQILWKAVLWVGHCRELLP